MKDEDSTKVKIETKIDFTILDNENLQIVTSHQSAFNDVVAARQVEVMRLKDEGIRQALVKLGWTPPWMAPSILEENVRSLQGIIDDLRIILGAADGERITDAARRAATPQPAQAAQAEVTDSMIREAFLANGFTIKDGHSDLKPYVYAAARAILALRPVQAEAQQLATPEPVVDVRCEGCGYMTHHREHMGCVRAAKQHTHPAPSVPATGEPVAWTEIDASDESLPPLDKEVLVYADGRVTVGCRFEPYGQFGNTRWEWSLHDQTEPEIDTEYVKKWRPIPYPNDGSGDTPPTSQEQAQQPAEGGEVVPKWWMRETEEGFEWTDTAPLVLRGWTPLYTAPPASQEQSNQIPDGYAPVTHERLDELIAAENELAAMKAQQPTAQAWANETGLRQIECPLCGDLAVAYDPQQPKPQPMTEENDEAAN